MEIIAIVGPTASGKTRVAVELAEKIGAEIISCDSRQVYRYLDIGTNKDGVWNEKLKARFAGGIAQYLTDVIYPDERFSAGQFRQESECIINKLDKASKKVIITGGTGLYLRALSKGLAPLPEKNDDIRKALQKELEERGIEHLNARLMKVDPVSAVKNRNNTQRVIRALEVFEISGMPLSKLHEQTVSSEHKFRIFGLGVERNELISRISKRALKMINDGLAAETQKVLEMGYSELAPGLESIGYRSCIKFNKGLIGKDELCSEIIQDTRQYAKRQMTWFRRETDITWLEANNLGSYCKKAVESILKFLGL